MGFLDGLFGHSRDRKPVATNRCMDCGTADGAHTDWCPSAQASAPGDTAPSAPPVEPPEQRDDVPGT